MKYKIFVINLKRNPERLSFMTEQLKRLKLEFTVQEGVDGSTFDFTGIYDDELFKKYHNGESAANGLKGCALSHRKALEKMLTENLDYAIVMEDDVELKAEFKKIIEQEINEHSKGARSWEYLSFNYPSVGIKSILLWLFLFFNMTRQNKKKISYWIKLPIYLLKFIIVTPIYLLEGLREKLYRKIFRYGRPAKFHRQLYLAGCYLVTKEGAKKLVSLNEKLQFTADDLPNATEARLGLKYYAFVPLVARQKRETFPSELNNESFGKKIISY